jgi:DNA-binding beta-propeller fold protein YncE
MVLLAVVCAVLWFAPGAFAADSVYWGNYYGEGISHAALDGSGGADLNTTGATPAGPAGTAIDLANGKIYWTNYDNDTISYANLDGSGGGGQLDTTGAPIGEPWGIAVDPAAGKIYWANFNDNTISWAHVDGSGGGQLATTGATVAGPSGVVIDLASGRIYWTNNNNDTIDYANLDGSGGGGQVTTTGATISGPSGLAIDSATGTIYWANYDGGTTISYAALDGSGGHDLNTTGATVDLPIGIAIDPAAGRIYWANYGGTSISYANVDGSGGADLSTTGATTNGPLMPVLLETPDGSGAPAISGGSAPGSSLSCSQGSWAGDLLESFLYRAPQSFSYQWSLNGTPIAGATSASYTATAQGQYTCTVTATNQAGSAHQTSAPHAVTAKHMLTVTKRGTGQGTVTSSPSGIDCGSTCSASYTAGTTVTLTATAASSSKFTGWTGACTGVGLCSGMMNTDVAVTATFKLLAPNTKITHASINAANHTASFKFKAVGKASGFQCALVKQTAHPKKPAFKACRSPKTYKHLAAGRYRFLVRAHNSAGPDRTPASKTFTIRTPHPPAFTG